MTTHHLHLHDKPFRLIKSGEKTVESRLYDKKRKIISVGDFIEFTNRTSREKLTKVVKDIQQYDSFHELLNHTPINVLGAVSTEKELQALRKFYSKEDEQYYGVVAIVFE